jgi:hypothetical protein
LCSLDHRYKVSLLRGRYGGHDRKDEGLGNSEDFDGLRSAGDAVMMIMNSEGMNHEGMVET